MLVGNAVAEIMLAAQEEAVAAALSKDFKVEEKEEKEEEVVAQAPADPKTVAEDSDGINRVLFNCQNQ